LRALFQKLVEGFAPVELTDLLIDALGSQEIADPAAHSHNTQVDTVVAEFGMQLMQHARAGEVDIR
jgi:hypothetical protein